MIDNFTKKVMKQSIKSILFFGSIYITYSLLRIRTFFSLLLVILGVMILVDFWPILKENSWKYVKGLVVIAILFQVIMYSAKFGIIGFLVIVLGMAVYRMYRGRKMMMEGIRNIEKRLFGHTLDKEVRGKNDGKSKI